MASEMTPTFELVYIMTRRLMRHVLRHGDTVVGRSSQCTLVIADKSISRRHASFRVHGPQCTLTDLNSANGTYLNDVRVAEGQVNIGDVIRLGDVQLRLELQADDEGTSPGDTSRRDASSGSAATEVQSLEEMPHRPGAEDARGAACQGEAAENTHHKTTDIE